MTNEEKANALAKDYLLGHDRANITYEEMLGACLDMAEWKDQQFREYLEKKYNTALNAWDDWAAYDPKTAESWRVKTQYIREIINELFPATEQNKED